MILFSNKNRPFHFGPFPLERLPRDPNISDKERARPRKRSTVIRPAVESTYAKAIEKHMRIFGKFAIGEPWPVKAPVPRDIGRRTIDIKGAGYFLDASQIGICELDPSCWYEDTEPVSESKYSIVIMVEYPRQPERTSFAHDWLKDSVHETAAMRAYEIAVAISAHIRILGFRASAHSDHSGLDREKLTILSGLGVRLGDKPVNPFLDTEYCIAVVTTDYGLACDLPLATRAIKAKGPAYWLGIGGATSGLERWRQSRRATHSGKYPMEQVKRVEKPTTLILEDEVPRVPRRAGFFERAVYGDLGEKSRQERKRFAFKHPLAKAMAEQIVAMIPEQDGPPADVIPSFTDDPEANSNAIKSLSYALGSDITGICEIPDYAWYSHNGEGEKITPHHRYAVVCVIDQGFDTMEGSSGDDFISGAQAMRAYMRGSLIAGIMAKHLSLLGHSSRPQTSGDSEVQHIPLLLNAGLGELSRIGELILNPFLGPRFKSIVITTNLPMVPDKPIDFGLQYFCSNCLKCARECPCDAIPLGDKVMFNGYEIWKPDVERCARYRITNQRGLACGRCMKMCPLNKVISWDGPITEQAASWCGVNAFWLKPLLVPLAVKLDDILGHGIRNPVKKWWLDIEIVDGVCVEPTKGVNDRNLDIHRNVDAKRQKIAYYHADMMPPPDSTGIAYPVNRKDALVAASKVETPEQALSRRKNKAPMPAHYAPTPPINKASKKAEEHKNGKTKTAVVRDYV